MTKLDKVKIKTSTMFVVSDKCEMLFLYEVANCFKWDGESLLIHFRFYLRHVAELDFF